MKTLLIFLVFCVVDLFHFFAIAQKLGGYDKVTTVQFIMIVVFSHILLRVCLKVIMTKPVVELKFSECCKSNVNDVVLILCCCKCMFCN